VPGLDASRTARAGGRKNQAVEKLWMKREFPVESTTALFFFGAYAGDLIDRASPSLLSYVASLDPNRITD
jgi:hypothetical protein